MLLGNYGREQHQQQQQQQQQQQVLVGDTNNSSFEGLHLHQVHHQVQQQQQQPPHLTEVPSPGSNNNTRLHHLSADQMLACQQQQHHQQQQQPRPTAVAAAASASAAAAAAAAVTQQERRLKPQSDQVLKCPRCDSMNTKFCYYNNYSLTQPRHFCKTCKRYWTKGGALRNVPVGGGCRKNKRVKQRQQDHSSAANATAAPTSGGDELSGGGSGGTTGGALNDGASSSSILQQEFSSPSAAGSGLYHDVHKGPSGGLPFERVSDHVSRIYSGGPTPPISINWAGQMALSTAQTYDAAASMLGLNLPIKQEHGAGATTADLTSMFDPSLAAAAAAAAAQGMGSYHVPMDNFGFNGPTGEVLWRFPQPKLVSLLEDGANEQETRQGILDLEAGANGGGGASAVGDKLKPKSGKHSGDSGLQVSGEYDQADSSSQEWQQGPGDSFFEGGGGDTSGYWSNGATAGWSSELHPYAAGGGGHQQQGIN